MYIQYMPYTLLVCVNYWYDTYIQLIIEKTQAHKIKLTAKYIGRKKQ